MLYLTFTFNALKRQRNKRKRKRKRKSTLSESCLVRAKFIRLSDNLGENKG